MVEVPLTQGRVALVDDEDAAIVLGRSWHLHGRGYAASNISRKIGRGQLLMHRELLGLRAADPLEVDHVNGNRLDNRRANLRIVNRAQNRQNTPAIGGSSQHRGVSRIRKTGRWRASAQLDGRHVHIGCFATEGEAAEAAAAWRREHMPFATA